jgi:hypothetical protein
MLILLAILIFIYNFTAVFYFLCRIEPSPTVEFLYVATFPCGVVWWLRAEKRKTPVKELYCEGLLAGYGWIVIIPYQLLKTRGTKGLLPIAALLASYFGSMALAAVFYFLFVADFSAY